MTDFDDVQIERLILNWFTKREDIEQRTGEKFWNLLKDENNQAILELARTPLLLTFLCLVYDSTQRLPANRAILYKRALEILLEKWAAEKRIHDEPIYRDLHPELEIVMLSQIAGPAFEEDKVFFTLDDLSARFSKFLKEEVNAPKVLNASLVIEAIEVQQGLLVQRASNVYSFSHLTIQEYLAANYFCQGQRRVRFIERGLFDRRWREMFLLCAGFSQADELLLEMADEIQLFVSRDEPIRSLLSWACNVCYVGGVPEEDLLRRAAALYCGIALRHAYNYSINAGSMDAVAKSEAEALVVADGRVRRTLASILNFIVEVSSIGCNEGFNQGVRRLLHENIRRTRGEAPDSDRSNMQRYGN